MITSENKALELAENIVKKFAKKHKDEIKQNSKSGDTLGYFSGTPLFRELEKIRYEYLKQVSPQITRTTNYFNIAIIRYILKGEKHGWFS